MGNLEGKNFTSSMTTTTTRDANLEDVLASQYRNGGVRRADGFYWVKRETVPVTLDSDDDEEQQLAEYNDQVFEIMTKDFADWAFERVPQAPRTRIPVTLKKVLRLFGAWWAHQDMKCHTLEDYVVEDFQGVALHDRPL